MVTSSRRMDVFLEVTSRLVEESNQVISVLGDGELNWRDENVVPSLSAQNW
jgi:hypothetical protein